MSKINTYTHTFVRLGIYICIGFALLPLFAHAADLGFSPSSGVSSPSSQFSVDIVLLNNTQSINAISGAVSFPADLLSVKSISKDGSLIKLWSTEPSYSNTDGTVDFEGVVFNPGFAGAQGKVLTITFVPKRTGKANVFFTSGSVLANDGKATNVLGQLGAASFVSASSSQVSNGNTTTPAENPLAPLAPKILSSTNPDSNKWYSNAKPAFSWDIPEGVTAEHILYDKNPSSIPTKLYTPAISSKKIDAALPDGVYYFHVQFKNSYGWGAVAHFRFQIDTTAPVPLTISFPHGNETDNPQPVILFNTTDAVSGIDHYEIKIGDGNLLSYAPEALSNPYAMPIQQPGAHTVVVRAIDKAGNSTLQSADFTIDTIQTPVITSYPKEIEEGDLLKIRGTTYPDATVTIFLKDKDGQVTSEFTKSDSLGNFALVWSKKLGSGVYEVTVQTTDNRGAKSAPTQPINISVNQKILFRVGAIVINYFSLAVIIIIAAASLISFAWYVISRLMILKRRLRRDIKETQVMLHQDLRVLKEDFKAEVFLLERAQTTRALTKEEATILKNLNNRVNVIEEAMGRKFDELKKDIK
jgi:hypothetical protein